MEHDADLALARALQAQFDEEDAHEEVSSFIPEEFRFSSPGPAKKRKVEASNNETSIIAPEWEDLDPTPDLHALFLQFNTKFFWGKLLMCEVKWSPRMTLCAGVCSYQRRSGYCSIRLSVPLLKLRPRKDLVETLLHEMIHAYLFVTDGDDDHDGHGPAFHSHMHRINKDAGTKISVYHNFHDEVALYKQHWWKCNGPCQKRPPFYGMVKRSMNRAPGPYDRWFAEHQANCGGTYTKVKEPEGYGQKKGKKESKDKDKVPKGQKDIRSLFGGNSSQSQGSSGSLNGSTGSQNGSTGKSGSGGGARGNIFGFGGTSFGTPGSTGGGGLKTKGRTGTMVVGASSRVGDNSSGGQIVSSGTVGSAKSSTTTSSADASPGTVRQTIRDFWANKFDGKGGSTASKPPATSSSKVSESSVPTTRCPVCRAQVEESQINQHLDRCLESPPPKTPSSEKSSTKSNPFVDDDDNGDSGPCPVCGKEVLLPEMNTHLDLCIAANQ